MDLLLSLAVCALLLLPCGYAALRLGGMPASGAPGLAAAVGLGWALVLPLLLLELQLGSRALVAPMALACLVWLRPGRAALRGLIDLAPDALAPLALALLVFVADRGDFERAADSASLRLGFDVADRVTYALVGDELQRAAPQRLEHPLFAPLPLQYSLFPALAGVLLERYAFASSLPAFLWLVPACGGFFTGIAVAGLLRSRGATRGAAALTVLLVGLGGDLSFLTATTNRTGLERAAHFFAFHSFSAESLLYNPWAFGLPLALVTLQLAGRFLESGHRAPLVLAGLTLGALWQTKVFAFLALVGGAVLAAAWVRRARLAAFAAVGLCLSAPWLLLTAASAGARDGWPLAPALLAPVRLSLEVNATLRGTALLLGDGPQALALGTLLFLVGGLGVRLLGLPPLWRAVRLDATGVEAWTGATCLLAIAAALGLRGHPMAVDGAQFLTLALYLLWLYAGPALFALRERRAWLALALVGSALVSPSLALLRKLAPERATSPQALDRARARLGPATLAACAYLGAHAGAGERVVLPLAGDPEDLGATKPLLVAALARRRVVAYAVPLSVSPALVTRRTELVARLYATREPAAAEAAVRQLGAQWIWDDARVPLGAAPPGWRPRQVADGLRLWHAP